MFVDFVVDGEKSVDVVSDLVTRYNNGVSKKDPHFLKYGVEASGGGKLFHLSGNVDPEEFITELAICVPVQILRFEK